MSKNRRNRRSGSTPSDKPFRYKPYKVDPASRLADPAEAERAALVARMRLGEEAAIASDTDSTVALIADDDLLLARYLSARQDGMPKVDLSTTYAHQRHAKVASAIADHDDAALGGPCGYCGSPTRRPAHRGFTTIKGHPACGFCHRYLKDNDPDWYSARVFGAVTGVRGWPGDGSPYYGQVLFAHELDTPYVGPAWGHVLPHRHHLVVMAIERGVPRRKFASTPGAADDNSLPGLRSPSEAPPQAMFDEHAPATPTGLRIGDRLATLHADLDRRAERRREQEEAERRQHARYLQQLDASQ